MMQFLRIVWPLFPSFTFVSPFLWSSERCSWFGAKIKRVKVYKSKIAKTLLCFETLQTSSDKSDTDAHQLLCSSVLHKPGTMAWTAWTVDGYPWKQEPSFCFHPSHFQETDEIVNVFHTHTRGSFHHKTQWRLHQDWPDLQSTYMDIMDINRNSFKTYKIN